MKNIILKLKNKNSLKWDIAFTWIISIIGIMVAFALSIGVTGVVSVLFNWNGFEGLGNAFYLVVWLLFIGFTILSIYNILRSKKIINKWFKNKKLFVYTILLSIILYIICILLFEKGEVRTIISIFKFSQYQYLLKRIWDIFFLSSQFFFGSFLVSETIVICIAYVMKNDIKNN